MITSDAGEFGLTRRRLLTDPPFGRNWAQLGSKAGHQKKTFRLGSPFLAHFCTSENQKSQEKKLGQESKLVNGESSRQPKAAKQIWGQPKGGWKILKKITDGGLGLEKGCWLAGTPPGGVASDLRHWNILFLSQNHQKMTKINCCFVVYVIAHRIRKESPF